MGFLLRLMGTLVLGQQLFRARRQRAPMQTCPDCKNGAKALQGEQSRESQMDVAQSSEFNEEQLREKGIIALLERTFTGGILGLCYVGTVGAVSAGEGTSHLVVIVPRPHECSGA